MVAYDRTFDHKVGELASRALLLLCCVTSRSLHFSYLLQASAPIQSLSPDAISCNGCSVHAPVSPGLSWAISVRLSKAALGVLMLRGKGYKTALLPPIPALPPTEKVFSCASAVQR